MHIPGLFFLITRLSNKKSFFTVKQINVANKQLSLDEIEHGILRRSKIKWSLGYLNKLFPSAFEKHQRADKADYRIHFALNCGAKAVRRLLFTSPTNRCATGHGS
jgi:hypothetical protein